MSIAQEEVFGPVAPIIVADDEVEAIELANDSALWSWSKHMDSGPG